MLQKFDISAHVGDLLMDWAQTCHCKRCAPAVGRSVDSGLSTSQLGENERRKEATDCNQSSVVAGDLKRLRHHSIRDHRENGAGRDRLGGRNDLLGKAGKNWCSRRAMKAPRSKRCRSTARRRKVAE